jgi:ATP-dependent DNA ligase
VIGGYILGSTTFDSILVGYYERSDLMYVGRIRNGFTPASRRTVFSKFEGLSISKCPFRNLPESGMGRWGEGLTAEDMKRCRWLKPQLVAAIEFLEWTPDGLFAIRNSSRCATTGSQERSYAKFHSKRAP